MKTKIQYLSIIIGVGLLFSCAKENFNHDGKGLVTEQQLIDLANAFPEAALTINLSVENGQYAFMREFATNSELTGGRHDDFGQKSIDLGMDLLSNDMVQVQDHWFGNYYAYRGRTQDFSTTSIIWNFYYSIIRNINGIIVQIEPETSDDELIHLSARAHAVRAFCYFNLVRVYQYTYDGHLTAPGVPLYNGADINITFRATVEEIYDLIFSDLEFAYTNIEGFEASSKEVLSKQVIAGIYARVLLETGTDWDLCVDMAREAKTGGSLMSAAEWVNGGFDEISNSEWMWGADINPESSTTFASFFSHMGSLNPGYAGILGIYKSIDRRLYDAIPDTDFRKLAFDTSYINLKFVDDTFFEGDYVYMRVAEMYLMEAEALARSGNDAAARTALYDLVSTRDPGYSLSMNSGQALIDEILLQRRIELWGEGFAWFDMKRTNTPLVRNYPGTNHVLFGLKDFEASANEFLFQIPQVELDNNEDINASDQNPL